MIGKTLQSVARLKSSMEVIVVVGGSEDSARGIASRPEVKVVFASRGHGFQLHTGAAVACGGALWFLDVDTQPSDEAVQHIRNAVADPAVIGGHFAIRFGGVQSSAQLLTCIYPQLCWLGLCYGDSGLFVRRDVYERVGGFRPYPIFEDFDLLSWLRRQGRLVKPRANVENSSRRFEGQSFGLTFAWWKILQILYLVGRFSTMPRSAIRSYPGWSSSVRPYWTCPVRTPARSTSSCQSLDRTGPET